ncbi:SNF2-like helicase [Catovirus CTV1]|uniref:Early transcription factor 70 kDa subunit n=1 Tax=Catovirus CTV1 TaxID=1977631 RepID=A0A1V0SBX9_9VIRU|nr:SNF2-like helicase [Catovirus CTV1]
MTTNISRESSENDINKTKKYEDKMNVEYAYPDPDDPEFQYKIYKKREFYYHKIPPRPNIDDYADIKEYRDNICARHFTLHEHQAMLSNFINPNTPYRGVLIFHGLGTGKCKRATDYDYVNGQLTQSQELWKLYSTKITKDKEGGEWSLPSQMLVVNSIDDKNRIVKRKVKRLYREKINSTIKEITLQNGCKIGITQIHKLLKKNGWSNMLKVNDYVAVPGVLYNCPDKNNNVFSDEALFIYGINIVLNSDTKIRNNKYLIEDIENFSSKNNFSVSVNHAKNFPKIESKEYDDMMKNIFVKDFNQIPDSIMNSELDKIKFFLMGILLSINNTQFKTKSILLLKQLYVLFKLFAINMIIKEKQNIYTGIINIKNFDELNKTTNNNEQIQFIKIDSIKNVKYDGYVYDLEIEENHNYVSEGLLCHNTCAAISIAEKFKEMVQKYNTKIYVLVSGPLIRENWKNELLTCTGETYLKFQDKSIYIDEAEKQKAEKNAVNNALQYYRFMSYRSFYKRVLGEKIVDRKVVQGSKVKVSYRKTEEGEFERDIAVDRIYNLNNSIIVVDEAHNLTGNAYGEALKLIVKDSTNLRLVLLSATPMKNLGDDIVELLNFLRPEDSQIERDKIFTNNKIHLMELKPGGLEYLKKMAQGYVSHVRGADPLIFAKRVDKGEIPTGLQFTNVIKCKMMPFQKQVYDIAVKSVADDSLDRKSEAVANFAFPSLGSDRKELVGVYGREGINTVRNQVRSNYDQLNKKIAYEIIKDKDETDLIYMTEDGKTVTGKILHMKYLKNFSTKFYKAVRKLSRLVWGKKGPKTAFVYSNLVKVGIELFQEILIQNGYLEFQENAVNYQIKSNTVCYFCGKTYADHKKPLETQKRSKTTNNSETDSDTDDEDDDEDSTDYEQYKSHMNTTELPNHEFRPATFVSVTGKSNEESAEFIPEDKQRILKTTFSHIDNKDGKYIKFVLGSKVMNEGISLRNVGEVHILDVYFNLGKVDQTVGRAIRQCSHYRLMDESNKFPNVNVYKYVVAVDNGLSTEEELYKKAESKYLLIKKVERALKEIAIDCPLNVYGNIFKEEVEKYKNCGEKNEPACPAICDYTKCDYKCENSRLNAEYYDPNRKIYKKISRDQLDYSTFTNALARNEIEYSKRKIKEMYLKKYVYTINNISEYVKNSYSEEKRELFDEFFVFKALDELIPLTENDFNNYKDTILDKFNRQGYLIYRLKYYIFQPFDQNEDVPMGYRTSFDKQISQKLSLYNYLRNTEKYAKYKGTKTSADSTSSVKEEYVNYNFDDTMDYYDNRDEFKYVGIIDKEMSRRKSKQPEELKDIFKIREKRAKVLDKKRGTGIPSLKGAVCSTSKNKEYLENIANELKVKYIDNETRDDICNKIKDRMLYLEKYSTGKNKVTYIMIPSNHPQYKFPYNLEDRVEYIIDKIKNQIKYKINLNVVPEKTKDGNVFKIIIKDDNNKLVEFTDLFEKLGASKNKNEWIISVD